MRPSVMRTLVIVAAVVMLVAVVAFRVAGVRPPDAASVPAAAVTLTASPQAGAPPAPAAAARPPGSPAPSPGAQTKPTAATQAKPTAAAQAEPGALADAERARIVREATWTPGQLQDHFEKHGEEGPWASESVYDASARETVSVGTRFTYVDRATNAERLGFFDKSGNRFTSVTNDGRRITTHFRPDRGESYIRGLYRSTYR